MSYFVQVDSTTFRPTRHVSGAWDPNDQHIAPALGLMLHAIEVDHRQRRGDDGLTVSRLSYDILGTVPVEEVKIQVNVRRAGRTIELVEATLSHGERTVVVLRAWFLQSGETTALAGSTLPPIPGPDELPSWDPTTVWPGGFIASVNVRRAQEQAGRAAYWVRSDVPLLDADAHQQASPTATMTRLLDIANGMTVRADPREVAFPNVDLTAHFFRQPVGDWLGFDTTVSFGPTGRGLTNSILHDGNGPFGTQSQSLTIRPIQD